MRDAIDDLLAELDLTALADAVGVLRSGSAEPSPGRPAASTQSLAARPRADTHEAPRSLRTTLITLIQQLVARFVDAGHHTTGGPA